MIVSNRRGQRRRPVAIVDQTEAAKDRFIESTEALEGRPMFIIADYNFWMEHEEELAKWLEEHAERGLYTREGMVLQFMNDEEAMWFKLRWF